MANDPIKLVDVGALDRFKTDIENEIPKSIQYSTMPTASAALVGKIVQYTGSTTASYTSGYFYKCVPGSTSGTYEWTRVNVQPGGGGGDIIDDDNISTETTYSSSKIEDICSGDDTPRWRKPYYVNGVKIVTFADGTIQELKDMVNAHMTGTIDIYDYWHVGDCRRIKINAIPAVENYCDASPAQYVYATIVADYYPSDHDVLFMVKIGSGLWNNYPMDDSGATLSDGFRSSKLNSYLQNQLFPAIEGSASTGFQSLLSPFTVRNFTSASTYVDDEVVMTLPSINEMGVYTNNFEINSGIVKLDYYRERSRINAYCVDKSSYYYRLIPVSRKTGSNTGIWSRSFYSTVYGYRMFNANASQYLLNANSGEFNTSLIIIPMVAIKGGIS